MEEQAREAIRTQGARVTATRVRVLAGLMASSSALSHQELLDRIGSVDRVTAYRVLEWLVQTGLAHRIAGEDRVWRFSVARHAEDDARHGHDHHGEPHGHFQCDVCRRMFCIDAPVGVEQNLARLPAGFEGREVDVVVRGLCPACAESLHAASARRSRPRGSQALRKESVK
ncbi:Fur family transcriptional regulator [Pigmentiphaga soli]|uniref:Fur family transcriptional regulator n=1 Tax=Pigmentiphaga soli TaxID=1007095 RepID=A0ABP8GI82_9BURK